MDAIGSVLGTVAAIGHEALFIGVDLVHFVPVPGLEIAARTLLNIWDEVEMVEVSSSRAFVPSYDCRFDLHFGR
jgi:abelson tyrosine-protein kinase 1